MFWFIDGLFIVIKRLSFSSKSHFIFSWHRILKPSKEREQLQVNKWWKAALSFLRYTLLLGKGEIPIRSPICSRLLLSDFYPRDRTLTLIKLVNLEAHVTQTNITHNRTWSFFHPIWKVYLVGWKKTGSLHDLFTKKGVRRSSLFD